MKVILQQDVIGLGDAGSIVDVKRGYARNFLIPRGMVLAASDKNMNRLDHLRTQIAAKQAKAKIGIQAIADKLEAFSCTIKVKAGESEKLFGSVTTQDIGKELNANGFDLDRRQIQLAEPIKMLGVYTVGVKLHSEVTAQLKVWVVSDGTEKTSKKSSDGEESAADIEASQSDDEDNDSPKDEASTEGSAAPEGTEADDETTDESVTN